MCKECVTWRRMFTYALAMLRKNMKPRDFAGATGMLYGIAGGTLGNNAYLETKEASRAAEAKTEGEKDGTT